MCRVSHSWCRVCGHYYIEGNFFWVTAWCRSGWDISPDKKKCLKYLENSLSWFESEAFCESYSGHLAAVTSSQELIFTKQLCGQSANGCWVGGRGINSSFGFDWKWSDNSSYWNKSLFAGTSSNSNCSSLSCRNNTGADFCTLLNNRTTYLMEERCNKSHAFICMIDVGMPL